VFLWTLSAIWEMSNTSAGSCCWQIVPLLNEMLFFITVSLTDYMPQRQTKNVKQVFPDPVFYNITGKKRQTTM